MPDPETKNKEQYQILLKKGYNQENALRIANTPGSGVKGDKTKSYEEWTKDELYQEARIVGIPGRSYMSKKSLIKSLRKN
ncbi:Rho termination factor [Flavobacterium sp. LC2016-23]|uniref:Rho termination factor n=1 Tax=Flavobacterium sp. LC2016-23 TaxID=2666330 RepID=UPI0012AF94BD|nr:Rho termination factor [Flavobacterium sp. LC2016-23]MRX38969.1 Rho termination factor [Flavobacterium sp. LC2016-23]